MTELTHFFVWQKINFSEETHLKNWPIGYACQICILNAGLINLNRTRLYSFLLFNQSGRFEWQHWPTDL